MVLSLEFPNLTHKQSYLDMISEWRSFEVPTSPGKLFAGESFEEFLAIVEKDVTENPNGVNSHLFFLVEGGRILGAIQIRHSIDHPRLIEVGGHIGYGIRPTERGKWYATEMLRIALLKAKKFWLERVLITCLDDNIASAKVIENNWGVFERYAERDEKQYRRYWIAM
jgi:predicted acetyltransferase